MLCKQKVGCSNPNSAFISTKTSVDSANVKHSARPPSITGPWRCPASHLEWHSQETSLLNGHKYRAKVENYNPALFTTAATVRYLVRQTCGTCSWKTYWMCNFVISLTVSEDSTENQRAVPLETFHVNQNSYTRFRIINTGSTGEYRISIDEVNMYMSISGGIL